MRILMIVAMMGWGLVWPLSKMLIDYGTPEQIAALRFLLVSLCFLPIIFIFRISFVIPLKALIPTLLTGVLNALYSYLMYVGMPYGDAGNAGVITEVLAPIMAAFLWSAYRKEHLSVRKRWGLLLGVLAGAILVNLFGDITSLLHIFHIVYLLAALDWAFLMITSRLATESINAISLNFYASLITFILLCPSLISNSSDQILSASYEFWIWLLLVAVFCTVFSTTIFYKALFVLGVVEGGIYALLVPVFALFFSYILLGEVPHWHTILGGILAVGSIYIINFLGQNPFVRKKKV